MHIRVEPDILRGVLFGVGLAVLGFSAAGAGHGTYVLIGASSAPVGVLGIWAALAGAPIFWAVVGAAFDWLEKPWRNRLVTSVMLLHYAGAVLLLSREPYGDWEVLVRLTSTLWPFLVSWSLLYFGGQIVIWTALFRQAG
jgi:hypothetical protein